MRSMKLKDGLYWNGALDPELRVFDIVMRTEFGTTYNSYLLKGSEKTALFETCKLKCFDEFIAALEENISVSKIDYIIVDHTEPDHAGSICRLIEMNPNIKIIGTATAIGFLKQIINRDFYSMAVKENDTISLGDKTLRFMVLPNLHWPDTMYTYVEEDHVLFTCDSFGSHYSHEGVLRSTVTDEEGYMRATKYYFDNIIGPYKQPYMVNALKRIEGLQIDMICTGHGPVLDSHIAELMDVYKGWCGEPKQPGRKKVIIPYVSAYGYTAELAENIAKGIEESGEIDVMLYDMVTADSAAVSAAIGEADGVLFGTPTIIGEALKPIWDLVTSMFSPIHKGKLASAFGSYGWSGEGVPHIIERLRQLKLKVVEGYRVRFKPSENEIIEAYDFGYNFGCILQNRENPRAAKKGLPGGKVKCLVCGEIFDASLDTCPVCGVGRENFVPVDEDAVAFRKDTQERFLILGGGAAAVNAAKSIRARNATCSIQMVSGEAVLPYNRPMLTKSMLSPFVENETAIVQREWYAENRVELLQGVLVNAIDTAKKTVTLENGTQLSYDKCIYALGASCFIPPFSGADLPEVIAVRTIEDVTRVQQLMSNAHSAVVIGGGVLGLEAAWELKKANLDVTVLEVAPQIMGRQIDQGAADMLAGIMEKKNIALYTGVRIAAVEGDGAVTGVRLEDGRVFPAQLVIVSCGIRQNTALAKAADIYVEKGVMVNERMETSADDVYACGDCAQMGQAMFGLWTQAVATGTAAGASAAGDADAPYIPEAAALTFNGMGTSLFAMGDMGRDEAKQYKTLEIKDNRKGVYEKYYFANGRLSGAVLIGDTSRMAKLMEQIESHAKFDEIIGL